MADAYSLTRRLVRALRQKRGWTQEMAAERAGWDTKYYQSFELGLTSTPTVQTLERLGKAFGVPAWLLICDELDVIAARTGINAETLSRNTKTQIGRPRKRLSATAVSGLSDGRTRGAKATTTKRPSVRTRR